MQVTVYAKVENIGWVPQYFDLVGGPENASPADFTLTVDQRGQKSEKSITAVEPIPGGIVNTHKGHESLWVFSFL